VRPAAAFALAALLATGLTACTGEPNGPDAAPTTAAPSPTSTGPQCPVPPSSDPKWPSDIPESIPKPAGFKLEKTDRTKGNVVQLRGTVPMSLRDAVLFVIKEFPKNGFVLGRGDAEATEADAPFQRGEALRGLVRVFATDQVCQTQWLFAVVRNTGAPFDLSYTPPPSSTPLPFG
jgi:hypothetical protein